MGSGQSREETECILEFTKRAGIATSARENPNAKLNGIIRQGSASALEQPLPSVQSKAASIDLYSLLQPGKVKDLKSMLEDEENDSLLDHLTPQKNTVLHIAACFGFNKLVEPILNRRPNLANEPNSNGDIPLHFAAAARYSKVIDTLVKVARQKDSSRDMFEKQNKDGDTPLHVAMRNNQKHAARLLITECREASYIPNNEEKSPLYMAAEAGDLKLVKIMLDYSPTDRPNTLSKGKSVVHAAITGKDLGVLKEILSKEPSLIYSTAPLMGKEPVYPLSYAAYVGNTYMVEYMVDCFPNCVSKMDESGTFPIHLAAEAGHKKVIEEFLRLKPESRELCTLNGENILHVAAKNGQHHVVKYLLGKRGIRDHINVNARDNDGNTPLHLATLKSYPKVVDTLTWKKRVRLDAVNNQGMTPMDVAMKVIDEDKSMDKTPVVVAKRVHDEGIILIPMDVATSNESSVPTVKKRLTWLALHYAGAPRQKYTLSRSWTLSDSLSMKSFKKQSSTLLVVATLVTTMSFTAGLQMPGGNGHGNSFLRRPMFQIFLMTNSMAFYASILSMLILFFSLLDDINLIQVSLRYGEPLLAASLILVSIAFMAAAYLVGSTIKWLAFAVWLLCSAFLAAFIPLFFLLFPRVSPKDRFFRFILRIPFRAMVYVYTFLAGE